MINYEELEKLGLDTGFSHIAPLKCSTIELLPEVRQMCEANTCGMYGKRWSCPPGCGTLEDCRAKINQYQAGILVQTVGELEDSMDGETMMETEALHKQNFYAMEKLLRETYPDMLAIAPAAVPNVRPVPILTSRAAFPRKHFLPWKPMACWSPKSAKPTI